MLKSRRSGVRKAPCNGEDKLDSNTVWGDQAGVSILAGAFSRSRTAISCISIRPGIFFFRSADKFFRCANSFRDWSRVRERASFETGYVA